MIGDLYAQVAAGEVGARRLTQMLEEFDLADIEALSDEIIDRSEQAVRTAVAAFPQGVFRFACENDGFETPLGIVPLDTDAMIMPGTEDRKTISSVLVIR